MVKCNNGANYFCYWGERNDTTRSKLSNWTTDLAPLMNGKIFSSFKERRSEPLSQWFQTFWRRQVVLYRSQSGWVLPHPCTVTLTQSTAPVLVSPKSVMSQLWMWGLGAPHLSCNVPKDLQCDHTLLRGSHCFKWHHLQNCLLEGVPSSGLVLPGWQRDSDLFFTESAEKSFFLKNFSFFKSSLMWEPWNWGILKSSSTFFKMLANPLT